MSVIRDAQVIENFSVVQLKNFLQRKGVSVPINIKKPDLINLCKTVMHLKDDPNFENCDTWMKVERKLQKIGLYSNPLDLKFSKVVASNTPAFGLYDIFNYLLYSRTDYDNRKLKAYKSFNDYQLFQDGHVRNLELHVTRNCFHVFKASVLPTCKTKTFLNLPTYTCWFILNHQGDVYTAFCECMGG